MIRAGVFVGVDQTGGLQKLNDAAAGAGRMHAWALAQGFPPTHAKLITDENGKVSASQVYDAILGFVDGAGVDQLLLYFAGHGVNINMGEMWLLSDAPRNPNEAVNVKGSVDLARFCGIGHVVIISDACRVAPDGIQAANVRGQEIFPNEGGGDRAKPVDQFFACLLGRTAAEIKDPAVAAGTYSALYTDALLDALSGNEASILDASADAADVSRYVNPEPLQKYLSTVIPQRVAALRLQGKVNQNPDAYLMRHPYWLSRIERPATPTIAAPAPTARGDGESMAPAAAPRVTLRGVARDLLKSATQGPEDLKRAMLMARVSTAPGAEPLADNIEHIATPFGPDHFETQCGFKVRGARLVDGQPGKWALVDPVAGPGDALRVGKITGPAASVLLTFANGRGTLLPAMPGFITALTFEDDELIDVAYEPSSNDWRWSMYEQRAAELRALRAIAASASRQGRFRLEDPDAMEIARKMQYAKSIDPGLAIYAAYAYHDLQALDRIREMSSYLSSDLGVTFFDLALLARKLVGKRLDVNSGVVPFLPMMSQGWSLLRAHRIDLHPTLAGIQDTLCDSLWSLYSPRGVELLRAALATGELR